MKQAVPERRRKEAVRLYLKFIEEGYTAETAQRKVSEETGYAPLYVRNIISRKKAKAMIKDKQLRERMGQKKSA